MPISRRRAIKLGLAGAAAIGATRPRSSGGHPLPNILWVVSEDNNPFIGAYGDPVARTPTLDALAKKGVLFRNVYSSAPVCAPSRFSILTGVTAESCAPANQMRAVAKLPPALRTYPEYLRSAGYYCTNNDKTDYNCDVQPARIWDDSSRTAHWRKRPADKPFMAVFNYMTSHESSLFHAPPGAVRPDQVRVPAYLPATPEIRAEYANYYNLMEKVDGEIGQRLAELEADGLSDDTIVIYYSDNGGVLPRSKRYCYDEGLRVSMIVHVPEKWAHLAPGKPGSVVETPVSLMDLAATMLSIAQIPQPRQMQGQAFMGPARKPRRYVFGMRNRMDERYDFVRTVTDGRYRYIRNYMPHRKWGMHGAYEWQAKGYQSWEREYLAGRLTPGQARFFQPKPYEEFYDLHSDPDEMTNRIADPKAAALVARFRQALDAEMIAIWDNGFIPEGSALEGYEPSRKPGAYPLRRIMALAQAAARGDPRKLGLLRQALGDPNEVVRYWGATGLLILGKAGAPALEDLRRVASTDPLGQIRGVAAEAMIHAGDAPGGVAILAALITPGPIMPVRLMALNSLTEIGDPAKEALPAIRQAASDRNEYIQRAASYLQAVLEGRYAPDTKFSTGVGGGGG